MKNNFTYLLPAFIFLIIGFYCSVNAQNIKPASSSTPVKMHKSVLENKQKSYPASQYQGSQSLSKTSQIPASKTSNWCLADKVTENYIFQQSQADPAFPGELNKMHGAIQQWIDNNPNFLQQKALKTIPVVVHVVYNNSGENVSDALIYDMINTLNEDFQRLNSDTNQTRTIFKSVAADAQIEFCLAQRDPSNNATTGITRTSTSKTFFDPDTETDDMKKNSTGGKDAWNPYNYLNIWIADIDNGAGFGTAGYAYLPTPGMHGSWRDGLVLDNNIGICSSCRTATHEIGHYLGLKHTWGNNPPACTDDDGFTDTPTNASENFGCSTSQNTCNDGAGDKVDQIENYMSYADCQNMYTIQQANYMNSVVSTTRSSLLNSQACMPTAPPVANFYANDTTITNGQYVQFFDQTTGGANSWSWNFGGGGTPNTSTTQNPFVQFLNVGTYTITLTAANSLGSDAETKISYINVLADSSTCDTINWGFLSVDTSLTVYGCGATCGYVVGTNEYDDVAKAQLFTTPEYSPNTHITGGLFYFAEAYKSSTSNGKVVFTVWDDNGTAGAPNTVLATDTVDLADIVTDVQGGYLTQALFIPPVAVSGNYYFGFQMVNFDLWAGGTRDTLALVETTDGISASSSLPWEKWSDGTWKDFVAAWGFISNTIFATPYMTDLPPSASFTADTLEGCGQLSVNFDASASTNGVEYYWDVDGDDTLDYVTYTPDISIDYSAPGTYSIALWVVGVCDGLDSMKKNNFIIINDVPALSTSSVNSSCGTCNGNATVTVSGGTSPFTYLWNDPAPAQTTPTATGLCATSYNVLVSDANGCSASSGLTVANAASMTLSTSATDEICNNGAGSVTASPGGGTSPYTYLWDAAAGNQTSQTATGLGSGTYQVTVSDNIGCSVMTDFFSAAVVNNVKDTINITSAFTAVSCFGGSNGSAIVTASGATSPYSYLWSISAGSQTNDTASGLSSGSYSVTVTDGNGCTDTSMVTITQPASSVAVDSITVSNAICNGSNGNSQAFASGGTGIITYDWSNGQNTANLLAVAGTYTLIVTDVNGCTDTANTSITEPGAIIPTTNATNATCTGVCNGTVSASASGGTSPYTYTWSNGLGTGSSVDSVCSGTFSVTITDANNCTSTTTATVGQPTALVAFATGTNATCNGTCNGTLTASASGGTSGYSFNWSGALGSGATKTSVCAGTYIVTVTDTNGCTSTFSKTISEPIVLSATLTSTGETTAGANDGIASVTSSGGTSPYTYLWSNSGVTQSITGLASGNYFITVTDANGCTYADSTFVNSAGCTLVLDSTMNTTVACYGGNDGSASVYVSNGSGNYTFSWSNGQTTQTATGLVASVYGVTATDVAVSGCKVSTTVSVSQPSLLQNAVVVTSPLCNGGSGSAASGPAGGTSPYTFTWSTGGTAAVEDSLFQGTYTLTLTDIKGCTDVDTITVSEPSILTVSVTATGETAAGANDGVGAVTVSGGTSPYVYDWNSGQSTATATGLAPGSYSVTVTDNNGCISADTITIDAFVTLVCLSSTPYGNADALQNNTELSITNCNWAGEYATIDSIQSGETYQFASSKATDWLTLTDNNDSLLLNGTTPLLWTATFSGTVYLHIFTDSTCGMEDTCRVTSVQCTTCPQGPTCVNSYSYGTATAPTNNIDVEISDCNYAGDYASINAVSLGETYVIGSSKITDWLTLTDLGNNLLLEGPTPLTWTATFSGNVRLHILADSTCGTENACRITSIQCSSCCAGFSIVASSTPETAAGASDGTASVAISGGNTPYTYLWSNNATTSSITNLAPANYSVTVTDAGGCSAIDSATVNAFVCTLTLGTVSEISSVNCFGGSDGQAVIVVNGGNSPYFYQWSNGDFSNTPDSLAAGTFTVTVTDNSGCSVTGTITLSQPTQLAATLSTTDETPAGANNGTATVSVSGGTTNYSYLWSASAGNQTSSTATGLSAGFHCVTVSDANGCTATGCDTVNALPCNLSVLATSTDESMSGANDGTASASPAGGNTPYSYSWSNGGNSALIDSLPSGNYCVTVTDYVGCSDTVCVNVNAFVCNLSVTVSATDETLAGNNDGTATTVVAGGNGAISYLWNTTPAATTPSISGLAPAMYCVTVTDSTFCTASACDSVGPGLISVADFANDFFVSLYPNPVKDNLFIHITLNAAEKTLIEISNCLGQIIHTSNFNGTLYNAGISTVEWGAGIYFVSIKTETKIKMQKIVIE